MWGPTVFCGAKRFASQVEPYFSWKPWVPFRSPKQWLPNRVDIWKRRRQDPSSLSSILVDDVAVRYYPYIKSSRTNSSSLCFDAFHHAQVVERRNMLFCHVLSQVLHRFGGFFYSIRNTGTAALLVVRGSASKHMMRWLILALTSCVTGDWNQIERHRR